MLSHEANIEGIQTSNKRTNETVSESEISSQDHQTRSEAEQLDGNIPTSEMRSWVLQDLSAQAQKS